MKEFVAEALQVTDEETVLNEIMTLYGQDILQLVYSYVKNHAVAEDLTQEIFVKCYRSLHTYEQKASLRTWLWRIAINHCKDYLRSWHYRKMQLTEMSFFSSKSTTNTPEEEVIRHDEDAQLSEAVLKLPVKYREMIYLFYFEEYSIKEIENITHVKQGTIKTRLRRAKELLKHQLGE
ncbi:sigma-70 family RNA polymerase sigma factor [Metabacillus iocasae]|uniref:RNA polymerase sigma-70 factor (ECF subfamily) n=1 Tax=Priestia iocasae TaxID=2291674 RepID=A0ABS2QUR7_9BACI|nr:sigma-70 family RNA polymerase sigma factor [Metabacillus iocasae]MBM7702727.1 RNA polymerase sigma-70 factor (ECF subfamily) [Metabacillus iocasae]